MPRLNWERANERELIRKQGSTNYATDMCQPVSTLVWGKHRAAEMVRTGPNTWELTALGLALLPK